MQASVNIHQINVTSADTLTSSPANDSLATAQKQEFNTLVVTPSTDSILYSDNDR